MTAPEPWGDSDYKTIELETPGWWSSATEVAINVSRYTASGVPADAHDGSIQIFSTVSGSIRTTSTRDNAQVKLLTSNTV